jgi:hypothetical protein
MKNKVIIMLLCMFMMGSAGCGRLCSSFGLFCKKAPIIKPELNPKKDITDAHKAIKESNKAIKVATKDITKEAITINHETTKVQKKVPDEAREDIDPHLDTIKESSDNIIEDTKIINEASVGITGAERLLVNAKEKIATIEKALETMAQERDQAIEAKIKAENERDAAIHRAIKWLILASIVGAGALGVFGFMYNSKLSLTLAAMCIVVMSIAIFVEAYFVYVVIGGGIILAALVGVFVYNIIIQKRAFNEVVDTVEITQEQLDDDDRKKLFGGPGETGIMDGIQSKTTIDMVQKKKSKMSSLWRYAKVNREQNRSP